VVGVRANSEKAFGSGVREDLWVYWPERRIMSNEAEKGRLAEEVGERWISFQEALSEKRKYPTSKFNAFAKSTRKYIRVLGNDSLIHRHVANAIHGLVDFLTVERRRVPDAVIQEADRLESIVFSGYDPYFDGDEPPGL
jgi:hypothetical protein